MHQTYSPPNVPSPDSPSVSSPDSSSDVPPLDSPSDAPSDSLLEPPSSVPPSSKPPSLDSPSEHPPSEPQSSVPPTFEPPTSVPPSSEPPSHMPSSSKSASKESPTEDNPSKLDEVETPALDEIVESPAPVTAKPLDRSDISFESPTGEPELPVVTKSPLAIETNPIDEDEVGEVLEQNAIEQAEQTQSDVIMYDASSTPIPAKKGLSDPFAIPDISTSTVQPVVLNIGGTTSMSEPTNLMTYVRGKTTASDSSMADTPPNVIGGRNTYVDTEDSDILSASTSALHDFLRYSSVAFAGISLALLLFFHFVSLDATLLWVNAAWSPNTWEFIFYISYLQQMQITSELTLLKTPYFLWDYTDSFAWSNFLIQDTTSTGSPDSRRLETIILGGLVSYADRIGIPEDNLLIHGAIGFAVIMGILVTVFLVLAVLAKRKAERALDDSSDLSNYTSGVHRLRSVSIRALGLCVLVWYFALFPLSMLASFEISMEVQAAVVADPLIVAIIALVLVCFGVLAIAGRVIMHKSKDELEQFENLATWGSLYCEYTYRSRMFFVIDVVAQISTGVLVGCVSNDPTQLIAVMAIQAFYLACVFIMSPFADEMVLRITYILGLLKMLNFGLAFAFLGTNTMSATSRSRIAHAYIGINSIVIIVWFVRQLVVFSTYIRAWMARTNEENQRNGSTLKYERHTDTESELWASHFTVNGNQNRGVTNQFDQNATLSFPGDTSMQSMQSMQPSFQSSSTSYNQMPPTQSMADPPQYQHHSNRKYEIGF
ncbi:putative transient receptor potential channel Flc/Pkd2 [Plasmopara halstedii]